MRKRGSYGLEPGEAAVHRGWLPPAHAKLRVRSRTTIGRPHPILGRLFTTHRPAVATFSSAGDAGQDEDLA